MNVDLGLGRRVFGPPRFAPMCASVCMVAGIAAQPLTADVRLPAVFGDHMVLQQDSNMTFWGWAAPGERVTITADWSTNGQPATASAVTGADGRWQSSLRIPGAQPTVTGSNAPAHTLTITGNNTITLRNVAIGEVWVCSGQSNMEWPLAAIGAGRPGVPGAAEEIAAAKYPSIRFLTVPNTVAARPRADCEATWAECSPETARSFSAVGYFFGRQLHDTLKVPIGLISADWGGTVAEAWTPRDALSQFPYFAPALAMVDALDPDPNVRAQKLKTFTGAWWNSLDTIGSPPVGDRWTHADFNDSDWSSITIPSVFTSDGLAQFDGVVYLRRTVDVPAAWADQPCVLSLGPIDDRDDALVNGVLVGSTREDNQWNVPRVYQIPAGVLKPGKNAVCVRVLDTGGPGGIHGDAAKIHLAPAAPTSEVKSIPLAGDWRLRKGPTKQALPPMPGSAEIGPNTPSALYNAMIAPITGFSMRGVIWYQGESNRYDPELYARVMPAMIRSWRENWRIGDFPFLFTQIAPFAYPGDVGQTAELREAQVRTLAVPATAMAVTLDIGNPKDIHPDNKQEVGRRLALLALAGTYARPIGASSGPLFKGLSVDGAKAKVTFSHTEQGLNLRPGTGTGVADGFLIAGADRRYFPAVPAIAGDEIHLSSPHVPNPVAVRYAWSAAPAAILFNGAGLPASPFRTDDWPRDTVRILDEGKTSHLTDDPDFKPLFNGTDLTGWTNVNTAPSTWAVRDNMIVCSGKPTGLLRTNEMYENFELELEWRHIVAGGNAGVFIASDAIPVRGQPFTRAVEVQVMDGAEGDWFTSDGDIFPIHGAKMTPDNPRGNSNRSFPTEKRMNPSPEWNHYRITCNNGSIALAVNGKVVTTGREISPRKGYICLESEGTEIHFRNIRLKRLPDSPNLPPEHVALSDEGFVPLYTGVDLSNWKAGPEHAGHFVPADWTLNFDGQGADLWSEKSYSDFVLICDWRWSAAAKDADVPVILPNGDPKLGEDGKQITARVKEAGDSGIYLRGNSKSQVNIWCWPIGSGEVYGYRTDPAMPPEVRAGVTPREAADAPIGQWNRFVITMKGDRLTVVLNGKTVIENARLPGVPESGPIALQMHGGSLQFSNIYIKELRRD